MRAPSTEAYLFPSNALPRLASDFARELSSAVSETCNEQERISPCFERISAVWDSVAQGRLVSLKSNSYKGGAYNISPRERMADGICELGCLAVRPFPTLEEGIRRISPLQ